jgi:hypothetical protein
MRHLYSFTDFLNEGKVEDIQFKYYSDMEPTTFHQIITADPTSIARNGETKKMGTYSKWLLKLFQDSKLLLEDLYKATEYLSLFDKLKAQKVVTGTAADINRYGSLPDLFKYIKLIGGTGEVSEDESYLLNDRYYINSGEAEVFHEDDDYLIVIPRSLKASQFYAHNTEWCTKYPDNFKEYSEQGDLYVIIDKRKLNTDDDNRMMQFHFQSMQFMDINDERLPPPVKVAFLSIFQQVKESWRLRYDKVGDFTEGRASVRLNGKYGFIDLEGNEVVSPRYDWVGDYREGRAIVELNKKWGVVDLDGRVAVTLKYDSIYNLKEGRIVVEINSKYGVIDLDENEVVPPRYGFIGYYHEGRASIMLNGKWGVIDLNGNEVVSRKYTSIGDYQEGRASVQLNGKQGFIDLNGIEVVPPKYDFVFKFHDGMAKVELDRKWGFVDLDGNEVVPTRYDFVGHFTEGRIIVKLDGKYGVVGLGSNVEASLIYDYVDISSDGRVNIEINGKRGYIDLDGNEYWD